MLFLTFVSTVDTHVIKVNGTKKKVQASNCSKHSVSDRCFFFYCRDPEHSHFRKMALAWTQKPRPPDVSSLLVGRDSQSRERFVLKEETLKQPIADKGHTKMLNQRLVWEIWIIFEMGIIQSYSKGVELKTSVTDQCRANINYNTAITVTIWLCNTNNNTLTIAATPQEKCRVIVLALHLV